LPITVPAAGTVIVSGAGTSTRTAAGPATLTFRLAAAGKRRQTLARTGVVLLRLTVTFIPNGGERNSKVATIRLKKKS
jgi:hypothetical protein